MRRVGSITLGFSLILFGILGICAVVNPAFSIQSVLKFWPAVLIGFGIEVLIFSFFGSRENVKLKYDGASILFLVLLVLGSFLTTGAQIALDFIAKLPPCY